MVPDFGVEEVGGALSFEYGEGALDDACGAALSSLNGSRGYVGGFNNVIHFEEGVVRLGRFRIPYIESGPREVAALQCVDQCGLNDDGTAGGIDKKGAFFKLG